MTICRIIVRHVGETRKRARRKIATMAIPRYRGRVAAAVARDAWDVLKIYSIYRTPPRRTFGSRSRLRDTTRFPHA